MSLQLKLSKKPNETRLQISKDYSASEQDCLPFSFFKVLAIK